MLGSGAMTAQAPASKGRIFGSKLKLIQVARRDLDMTDEDYRDLLQRSGGVKSSTELTLEGFDAVMAEFKRLGFNYKKSGRKPKGAGGTAPNHPTPAQWRLIEDRAKRVGYSGLEDPRFVAWVKPRGKVEHPRFLDNDGAQRVIKALGNWIDSLDKQG
jgi:hypothetical protein